jgi:hypothetical protein
MRNLDSGTAGQLTAPVVLPVRLAMLTFRSRVEYVWSGVGDLVYSGNTYKGVGSLGSVGDITEGIDVQAAGTSVTLDGINPEFLAEALTDIKSGAPAKLWLGFLVNGVLLPPYLQFSGTIDVPTVSADGDTLSITLSLESRLVDLQRPSNRRYTAADQHIDYPNDIAFNWVEPLNDASFKWGSA